MKHEFQGSGKRQTHKRVGAGKRAGGSACMWINEPRGRSGATAECSLLCEHMLDLRLRVAATLPLERNRTEQKRTTRFYNLQSTLQ